MKTLLTCGSILYLTLTLPVSAATFTADFNSGAVPAGSTISGTAAVNAAGGYTNSGGLRLTEAVGSQLGNWVVNDFSAGAAIDAFNATFKVELGPVGGADGFSLNWGTNVTGTAGEEGEGTGLTVAFDTFDNGGGEAPAIDIKWLGSVIAHSATPFNYSAAYAAFVPVQVTLANGQVTVAWNGINVHSNVGLVGFGSFSGAKFGFGARTGGSNERHYIDDVSITTMAVGSSSSPSIALIITNFNRSGGTSVIRWTAETNSFTNVFFSVQRTTNLSSNFTVLTNISENSGLAYTDSVSVSSAAFYRIAQSNAFTTLTQPGAFTAYAASSVNGLNTVGYSGAVFDGRYVYFVPNNNGVSPHGIVLRYDTQAGFTTASSWSAYNAGTVDGLNTTGYFGGVDDGRYIYFAPSYNSTASGIVLRYDKQSPFSTSSSWHAFDAGSTSGLNTKGYFGAVFDGRYVYFVPNYNGSAHGIVLRYDTQASFTTASSWSAYDAGTVDGLNTKGYQGGVCDGRYIYFVPNVSVLFHGVVLRYDTQSAFTTSSSWHAYDAGATDGLNTKGYAGAVFDGRYICFVPHYNGTAYHGIVLRYDTQATFTTASSWSAFDAGNTDGLVTHGYIGGAFDGRYICFVPSFNGTAWHGTVLRYDTQSAFTSSSSWHAFDAGNTSGLETRGYEGAVSDGRYIYFAPLYNGTASHGTVLRFDAKLPRAVPATVKGGSNL